MNRNQILAVISAVLSVLVVSTTNLTDLFGAGMAKTIVSAAGMVNMILTSILATLTGQAGIIKDAAAMPGVESIKVNSQANQTLAAIAVDPKQDKVAPTTKDETVVSVIANGGSS